MNWSLLREQKLGSCSHCSIPELSVRYACGMRTSGCLTNGTNSLATWKQINPNSRVGQSYVVVSKNSAYTKLRPESYFYSRSGRNRLTLLGLARPAREQISSTYELSISKCGSAQQRLVECTIHYAYRLPLPHRHTHTHTHGRPSRLR